MEDNLTTAIEIASMYHPEKYWKISAIKDFRKCVKCDLYDAKMLMDNVQLILSFFFEDGKHG